MALDTTASNVAMNQLQNLPFKNLIGGPLDAAIDAQAVAATTTVDFIKAIGLQEGADGQLEAVTLTFFYEDASGNFRRLTVPVLLVVPIPYIIIDSVDIAFKAKITASASQSSEDRKSSSAFVRGGASAGFGPFRASLYGGFSTKKDSKATQESRYSIECTIDVGVHASQAGIPQGMAEVLNILQDGIKNVVPGNSIVLLEIPDQISIDSSGPTADPTAFTVQTAVVGASGNLVDSAKVTMTSQNDFFTTPTPVSGSLISTGLTAAIDASSLTTPGTVNDIVTVTAEILDGTDVIDTVSTSRQVTYIIS